MDGGTWWATVNGVAKSQTRLNDFTFHLSLSDSLVGKESTCDARYPWSIPGLGRSA